MEDNSTPDVNGEIDVDIFADEVEPTTTQESSTQETKAPVDQESDTTDEAAKEESTEDGTANQSDDADDTNADDDQQDKPKRGYEQRVRSLVAERNFYKQETERLNSEVYHARTATELEEQGVDPITARIQAIEERSQIDGYNAKVSELNANINLEATQVLQELPMFNPDSDQYNADLARTAARMYTQAAAAKVDPNTGLTYQTNVLPYEFYKQIADVYSASSASGQVKGQRAAERMLASADTPPAAAPKPKKTDELTELWST